MLATETSGKRMVLELPQGGRQLASRNWGWPPRCSMCCSRSCNAVVELVVEHLPTGHRRARTSSAPCEYGSLHSQALGGPGSLQSPLVDSVHPDPPPPSLYLLQLVSLSLALNLSTPSTIWQSHVRFPCGNLQSFQLHLGLSALHPEVVKP